MNRILLADDSPHAQRMGERILRDEGYEVVSVTDGETALLRLADVDPEVIIADVFLPGRSGLDLCREVKGRWAHRHVRVILTAGLLEPFDEQAARNGGADAIIKKPFEASVVLETVKPLVDDAEAARKKGAIEVAPEPQPVAEAAAASSGAITQVESAGVNGAPAAVSESPATSQTAVTEEERIRAAVIVALDAAFPVLVDEITTRVLGSQRSGR